MESEPRRYFSHVAQIGIASGAHFTLRRELFTRENDLTVILSLLSDGVLADPSLASLLVGCEGR